MATSAQHIGAGAIPQAQVPRFATFADRGALAISALRSAYDALAVGESVRIADISGLAYLASGALREGFPLPDGSKLEARVQIGSGPRVSSLALELSRPSESTYYFTFTFGRRTGDGTVAASWQAGVFTPLPSTKSLAASKPALCSKDIAAAVAELRSQGFAEQEIHPRSIAEFLGVEPRRVSLHVKVPGVAITIEKVKHAIRELQAARGQEWCTADEVGEMLGVQGASINSAVNLARRRGECRGAAALGIKRAQETMSNPERQWLHALVSSLDPQGRQEVARRLLALGERRVLSHLQVTVGLCALRAASAERVALDEPLAAQLGLDYHTVQKSFCDSIGRRARVEGVFDLVDRVIGRTLRGGRESGGASGEGFRALQLRYLRGHLLSTALEHPRDSADLLRCAEVAIPTVRDMRDRNPDGLTPRQMRALTYLLVCQRRGEPNVTNAQIAVQSRAKTSSISHILNGGHGALGAFDKLLKHAEGILDPVSMSTFRRELTVFSARRQMGEAAIKRVESVLTSCPLSKYPYGLHESGRVVLRALIQSAREGGNRTPEALAERTGLSLPVVNAALYGYLRRPGVVDVMDQHLAQLSDPSIESYCSANKVIGKRPAYCADIRRFAMCFGVSDPGVRPIFDLALDAVRRVKELPYIDVQVRGSSGKALRTFLDRKNTEALFAAYLSGKYKDCGALAKASSTIVSNRGWTLQKIEPVRLYRAFHGLPGASFSFSGLASALDRELYAGGVALPSLPARDKVVAECLTIEGPNAERGVNERVNLYLGELRGKRWPRSAPQRAL